MSLSNALSYLTLLPIPFKKEIPLNRSVHHFPLIGAAMGSALLLVLLGLEAILPGWAAAACTIAAWEAMAWGLHVRSAGEWLEGKRTRPGFHLGQPAALGWVGWMTVAVTLLGKTAALALTRPSWQPFAILLGPILGQSAQALAIIAGPSVPGEETGVLLEDTVVRRRKIRALFLIAGLLFTFGAFPLRAAALFLTQYVVVIGCAHYFLRKQSPTSQSLGMLSELAEVGFFGACALLSQEWSGIH